MTILGFPHGDRPGDTYADRPCDTEPLRSEGSWTVTSLGDAIHNEWPPEDRGCLYCGMTGDHLTKCPMVEAIHKNPTEASKILAEASSLIDGDRHRAHGDRHKNFATIAAFWSVLFDKKVEKWQVARAFELAKIARDINGEPNRDNATDGAGYSALSWELRL